MHAIQDGSASHAPPLRPTRVEIDCDQLTENFNLIRQRVNGAQVMCVLKANAYGHGLVPVAKHLESIGAPSFAVAYVEEGMALRQAGIRQPILVFGGFPKEQISLFLAHELTMTASSVDKLAQIDRCAAEMGVIARVHLKFDTGMGRIGVQFGTADTLIEATRTCEHTFVEGVYSHFANADATDLDQTVEQLDRFRSILSRFDALGIPTPPLRHIANSAAIVRLPETYFDLVRAGILLYGVYPSEAFEKSLPVRPALKWRSSIVYFKVQPAHHPVSYGSTWQSDTPTRIVTIPVGYGDGYFRALSNRGEVMIHGRRYPIVGRVCMDQFMVDIGQDSAFNGDDVILIGRDADDNLLSATELADQIGTIPYEILTNINGRVPRVYLSSADD